MLLQRQTNGEIINIDESFILGVGGEARIYGLLNDPYLVAKVYHKPTEEKIQKLFLMLNNPPDNYISVQKLASIAWPIDLLYIQNNGSQQIVGFLMPRVTGMKSLINFYNPGIRRRYNPLFNYRYLLRAARNLSTAVNTLHVRGYVIGDINESNILVSDTALVVLVDTDSFQVRDIQRGIVYRCPVGKPEFTPPELQNKKFAEIDRLPEHDSFGLAVLIFQMLMEGTHPFAGVYRGSGDPPPYEERIAFGHFPYSKDRRVPYVPPKNAPPFEILNPNIRQLFRKCFEAGHKDPSQRPDARTWQEALNNAEHELIKCSVNEQHFYGNHLKSCPWCERSKQLNGLDPFPSLEAVRSGKHYAPTSKRQIIHSYNVKSYHPKISRTYPVTLPRTSVQRKPYISQQNNKFPVWIWYIFIPIIILMGFQLINVLKPSFISSQSYNKVLKGHTSSINSVSFSPDGKILASGSGDRTVKLWDVNKGKIIRELRMHNSGVVDVAFAPDGKTLYSSGYDGKIISWDVNTGQALRVVEDSHNVTAMALSPNGMLIAYGTVNFKIKIYEIKRWQLKHILEGHSVTPTIMAFSPDNRMLASGSLDGKIILWDVQTGEKEMEMEERSAVRSLAFSPDGKNIATGSFDNMVRIWDVKTGKLLQGTIRQRVLMISMLALVYSPNGKIIASASDNGIIRLWNARNNILQGVLTGHENWVSTLAFSPDGEILASGGRDKTIRLWNVRT